MTSLNTSQETSNDVTGRLVRSILRHHVTPTHIPPVWPGNARHAHTYNEAYLHGLVNLDEFLKAEFSFQLRPLVLQTAVQIEIAVAVLVSKNSFLITVI